MADEYVMKVAGELADLALADEKLSGDETIIDGISEILGASSQTLQEAYMTAVRVRRAERRARTLLKKRSSEQVVVDTPDMDDDAAEPETFETGTIHLGDSKTKLIAQIEDASFEDVGPASTDAGDKGYQSASQNVAPARAKKET
ncbi:hypothetical protein [Loktanella sp. Alg231-35]|uniref:hypothetical protein n=1 Tax=Loktanella sp. Alg231-35 TaxID=1922220 RepID=UPI002795D866|nr:hypothetical protein [Loktanella sp. Alg231-35]